MEQKECFGSIQNNIALKHFESAFAGVKSFGSIQNNIALKRIFRFLF
ncbi:hypothetical protein LMIV_2312 [Listeria monocytogenes FSL J1-208]|nr:hypothetical protein LMIV_2312 [Listeria monocytogenes FSL J1-208]